MLVFIHINKTAGSTVRYILRSTYGLDHCEVEPWHAAWADPPFQDQDLKRLHRLYPRLKSIAGHRIKGHLDLEADVDEFAYFTFLRDPIRTCASRFQYNIQYRKKTDLVFEKWIQNEWTRNAQTKMIAGTPDVDKALRIIQEKNIFVGLTEHFDQSMVLMKGLVVNNLNISYKRVNVAKKNTIAQQILASEDKRQMLVEANQADIALYNYVQNELYPSYIKSYGATLESDLEKFLQNRSSGFNYLNLTLFRLKHYMFYKPTLYLYRKGIKLV